MKEIKESKERHHPHPDSLHRFPRGGARPSPRGPAKREKGERVVRLVKSSENNTHRSRRYLDPRTRSLKQRSGSTGISGFGKSKRGTAYAAEELTRGRRNQRKSQGLGSERVLIHLILSGYGQGRLAVRKLLPQLGYSLRTVSDSTPVPHNGCRPKKPRRV